MQYYKLSSLTYVSTTAQFELHKIYFKNKLNEQTAKMKAPWWYHLVVLELTREKNYCDT